MNGTLKHIACMQWFSMHLLLMDVRFFCFLFAYLFRFVWYNLAKFINGNQMIGTKKLKILDIIIFSLKYWNIQTTYATCKSLQLNQLNDRMIITGALFIIE